MTTLVLNENVSTKGIKALFIYTIIANIIGCYLALFFGWLLVTLTAMITNIAHPELDDSLLIVPLQASIFLFIPSIFTFWVSHKQFLQKITNKKIKNFLIVLVGGLISLIFSFLILLILLDVNYILTNLYAGVLVWGFVIGMTNTFVALILTNKAKQVK